jgi:hypothetical protein
MQAIQFNRDALAQWYAAEHRKTDPGVSAVYYLRSNAAEREIRLVEVNDLIGERDDGPLEPIDFGVDRGLESAHRLFVLDVTPAQWERIGAKQLPLPEGWSLDGAVRFADE